jgi:hypothetical protein
MKWFNNWFAKKCRQAWEDAQNQPDIESRSTKIARGLVSVADVDSDEGLNITVRAAIGGKIVSFRHYDRKADRNYWKTYIIPEELDFERELGKMITLESMRG